MRLFPILAAALLIVVACSDILTSNKAADVETMHDRWTARRVASYDYELDQGGFFNACPRPVRAYVHANIVDSATAITSGQPVPSGLLACVPTIDVLFHWAANAAQSGALISIRYDAGQGYPIDIEIAGPPDASGWFRASALAHVITHP